MQTLFEFVMKFGAFLLSLFALWVVIVFPIITTLWLKHISEQLSELKRNDDDKEEIRTPDAR